MSNPKKRKSKLLLKSSGKQRRKNKWKKVLKNKKKSRENYFLIKVKAGTAKKPRENIFTTLAAWLVNCSVAHFSLSSRRDRIFFRLKREEKPSMSKLIRIETFPVGFS